MKIATWNLERLGSEKKLPAIRRAMDLAAADIWILTETRASLELPAAYFGVHAPPHPKRRPDEDERWVSIWSRWPLEQIAPAPSPRGSLVAKCTTPLGELIIYGTVLPWHAETGERDPKAKPWEVHYEEIERQGAEWEELRKAHPDAGLLVAGDFNQSRDDSNWYGTKKGRSLLSTRLEAANLVFLTAADVVAAGLLSKNHLIDHICLSENWHSTHRVQVSCWEPVDSEGLKMSDHPGVAVELTRI